MSSVPCYFANANTNSTDAVSTPSIATITELVKPPNVEELYDWYRTTKLQREPDADPSWGVLWPTAVSLANYLLLASDGGGVADNNDNYNANTNSNVVRGKTVIELGAGLGLCGLTAAALGAKSVLLTDREPYALHCALATAACNGFSSTSGTSTAGGTNKTPINGAVLDWCGIGETNSNKNGNSGSNEFKFDVVVASDVLYDGETIEAFAGACKNLLNVNNCNSANAILLVSDPKQERFPGAREILKTALLRRTNNDVDVVNFRVLDLPPPPVGAVPANTMDGRDHEQRMKESTVLIEVVFGPSAAQRDVV